MLCIETICCQLGLKTSVTRIVGSSVFAYQSVARSSAKLNEEVH